MITFRQHIEISKHLDSDGGFVRYVESLHPSERIDIKRKISKTYPIEEDIEIDKNILSSFNCHTKVTDLVLGQFIMVEQIITGKTNFKYQSQNDLELAKLLIRPKQHETFDNDNADEEHTNEERILNTDVKQIYAVLQKFLKDREFVLFEQFKGVFYEVSEEDDEPEEQTQKTGEALFHQQWYWYSMVRMLAKEDITKYNEIYLLRMNVVLPEMSFIAQRNKIEQANRRQQQAMSKL